MNKQVLIAYIFSRICSSNGDPYQDKAAEESQEETKLHFNIREIFRHSDISTQQLNIIYIEYKHTSGKTPVVLLDGKRGIDPSVGLSTVVKQMLYSCNIAEVNIPRVGKSCGI